jgi:glucose-6-phosphate isomerase
VTRVTLDTNFFPRELKSAAEARLEDARRLLHSVADGTCRGGEFTGWFDYPRRFGFQLQKELDAAVRSLDVDYDSVVVIGIGGSYLGTRCVMEALQNEFLLAQPPSSRRHRPIFFAGHQLTAKGLSELLQVLDGFKPVVNVISKSGTTTEPSIAFRLVRSYIEKRFGKAEASRRIIATTDPKSGALRQFAEQSGYRTFPVPPDVGGRFSVLTAVGLVPLCLAGYSTSELLGGADAFFAEMRQPAKVALTHPVLTYAAARKAAYDHGRVIEIQSIIDPKLRMLTEWWKQLFGESEGKEAKGIYPTGLIMTTDLHSLGQYVQQGNRNLFETFLTFRRGAQSDVDLRIPVQNDDRDQLLYLEGKAIDEVNEAAKVATKIAHFDGGVPCLDLEFHDTLSEAALGYGFAFFETACAVSALLLGVNPFDQPGVEEYKKNLFALMGRRGHEALQSKLAQRIKS